MLRFSLPVGMVWRGLARRKSAFKQTVLVVLLTIVGTFLVPLAAEPRTAEALSSSSSLGADTTGVSQKLFGLFVYAEKTLASSGYLNWDELGCGVFSRADKTAQFIDFFKNSENRIGQLKLDVVPLFKQFDQLIPHYDSIIRNATQAGIEVRFMESNSIPGDECADNCADTCKISGGGPDDSCTPSYMDYFHNMVSRLLGRYSDVPLGVVYDIEQTVEGDYTPVWSQIADKVASFEKSSAVIDHGSNWLGYSFVRPAGYKFSANKTMLGGSNTINFMRYFTPLDSNWDKDTGVIHMENGILDQIRFCKTMGGGCKVQIGFETSAEDPDCKTYARCKSSFVWGAGLSGSTSIIDWIENTLEPALVAAGVDVANDLATVPYFLEHQASAMAYFANVKKGNVFPATSCYSANPDCITCCPNQKHHSLCNT